MSKNTSKETKMIVESIRRRPYGAKLSVLLDDSTRMMLHGEACLLTDTDYIVKVHPAELRRTDESSASGFQAWEIFVEGFATAGEAEKKGLEVAFGILWGAVSENYSVRLKYRTPLPCVVYDRTRQGSGISVGLSATIILGKPLASIATAIDEGLSSKEKGNEKLLLAMELFASARQESTERSRFIGLVSSLEPLSEQEHYSTDLSAVIEQFKGQIKALHLPPRIEKSLMGRTDTLTTESVSSAIRRLVKGTLPDDNEALQVITEAYNLRSRILHDGTTDADLNEKSRAVEAVVRRIIACKAALALRVS